MSLPYFKLEENASQNERKLVPVTPGVWNIWDRVLILVEEPNGGCVVLSGSSHFKEKIGVQELSGPSISHGSERFLEICSKVFDVDIPDEELRRWRESDIFKDVW